MPVFARKKDRFLIITGPTHVLLGLVLGSDTSAPKVICNPRNDVCGHAPLDEERILDAVLAGIKDSGVVLHPLEIHYYEGDSPGHELYKRCGFVLARRIASGEEFPEEERHV